MTRTSENFLNKMEGVKKLKDQRRERKEEFINKKSEKKEKEKCSLEEID